MNRLVTAAALGAWAVSSVAAQTKLVIPVRFEERVRPLLERTFAGDVVVTTVPVVTTASVGDVLLLFDEWTLSRAAGSIVLSWQERYGVAVAAATFDGTHEPGWEELALRLDLDGRLGVVAPEVDGAPWLLAMREATLRRGPDGTLAMWTTIDARAAVLRDSYERLVADLDVGTLLAAIGPESVLSPVVARSSGRLRLDRLRGNVPAELGVALVKDPSPAARQVFDRLRAPELQQELAKAAGLEVAAAPASLTSAVAHEWWSVFETKVRGRGKGLEQLADGLDWVFAGLFLVCLWFLWRKMQREPVANDDPAPLP